MNFLQGKKTLIGAGLLALVGAVGFLSGAMSAAESTACVAAAFAAFGLGDKSNRHAATLMAELQEVKVIQQQIAAGKKVDVAAEVTKVAAIAISSESGDRV